MRAPDGTEARVNADERNAMRACGWTMPGERPREISREAAARQRMDYDQRQTTGQSHEEAQRGLKRRGLEPRREEY